MFGFNIILCIIFHGLWVCHSDINLIFKPPNKNRNYTMKSIFLFAALALPFFTHASDEDKKKKNFFEDSYLGVVWGPDFYFWKDKAPAGNTGYTYNPLYSQTFGFDFVKGVSERLLISVGLQSSTKSFERTDKCLVCAEGSYTPVSEFRASYTEVPVSAYFLLSNSRLDVLGILGVNNSIIREVKQETIAFDGSVQKANPTNSFNRYSMSVVAGVGFNYSVNLRMSWGMNLLYRQPVIKYITEPAVSAFGIGINTSMYYKF